MITLNTDNFNSEALGASLPVLAEFSAPWCGYCRRLTPVINRISEQYEGKMVVGVIDVDDSPVLAEQYGVDTIPTLILFQNGKASEPVVNPPSIDALTAWLAQHGVTR